MINFPVINSIHVKDYGLYNGANNDGNLIREMLSGVNLIVGVNGIGKTTLLTMLLRSLAGPKDIDSGGDLGRGARKTSPADKQYFARRVRDNAANATIKTEVIFGSQKIIVERHLKNLSIKYLKVNNLELKGENAEHFESLYERSVIEASGLPTFYDFILVLRFVCFFLEDRQPLIWDKNAQYEVLRALFGGNVNPMSYFTAYNKMTSLDSELRNHNAALAKMETRLQKADAAKNAEPVLAKKLQELSQLSEELSETLDALDHQSSEARKVAYDARQKLESAKFDLQIKRTELAGLQKIFLVGLFKTAEEDVAHRVLHTLMHGKCTVCGSTEPEAIATLRHNAEKGLCPVCQTPHDLHEHFQDAVTTSITADIRSIESRIENLLSQINALENETQSLTNLFHDLTKKTSSVRFQLHSVNSEKSELSRQLRPDEDTHQINDDLRRLKELSQEMADERKAQELIVKEFLEEVEEKVNARWQSIADRFRTYISGFMAETCTLIYKVDERTLFQGFTDTLVGFPLFSIKLTSGVFDSENEATSRNSITEVSESQKEFIDLAFRMSVIAEVANNAPSMFVVETPEASLDSVFVPRAGAMIRRFLEENGQSRSLIASVNLNREAMIPALFGVPSEFEVDNFLNSQDMEGLSTALNQSTPLSKREKHIINLLTIGIGNAALKKHTLEYEHEYQHALHPSWEAKAFDVLKLQN
jgi:hypothetical protein